MLNLVVLLLAAAPTPQEILAKVQSTYKAAGDITAEFSQSYTDSLRGKKRTESGKLWAAPDGRVRWAYEKPTPKDFVFDGEAAYFYEPEFGQVTVIDKFRDTQLANALGFLIGKGDLARLFSVEPVGAAAIPAGELRVVLAPKEAIPTVAQVELAIDAKTYRVLRTTVTDPIGNRTEYALSKVVFGAKVEPQRLRFTIPAGVQIIRSTAAAPKQGT